MGGPKKITIPAAEAMPLQMLRMHIQKRHMGRLRTIVRMGMWTPEAHAYDHRMNRSRLDHIHAEPAQEETA